MSSFPSFIMRSIGQTTHLSYANFTNPKLHLILQDDFFQYRVKESHWLKIIKRQKLEIQVLSPEQPIDLYEIHQEQTYQAIYHLFEFAQQVSMLQSVSPCISFIYSGPLNLSSTQPELYEKLIYRLNNLHNLFPSVYLAIENNAWLYHSSFAPGGYQPQLKTFVQQIQRSVKNHLECRLIFNYDAFLNASRVAKTNQIPFPTLADFLKEWQDDLSLICGKEFQSRHLKALAKANHPLSLTLQEDDPYECKTYKRAVKHLKDQIQPIIPEN